MGAEARIEEMISPNREPHKLFLVRLVSVGKHELNVVKMVHKLTELGLKESKGVDDRLGVVAEILSKELVHFNTGERESIPRSYVRMAS